MRQIADEIREHNKQLERNSEQAKKWDKRDLNTLKDKMSKDNPTPKPPVTKPYITSAGKK